MKTKAVVSIDDVVRVEQQPEIDHLAARRVINLYPRGARIGQTFLQVGRAAAGAVLREWPGADVSDQRIERAHGADGLKPKHLPGRDSYNLDEWVEAGGGSILVLRNTHHRVIPNHARNLACVTGQRALIVCHDVDMVVKWCDGMFDDWREYSDVGGIDADMDAYGLVIAVDCVKEWPRVIDDIKRCRAKWRYVIDEPHLVQARMAAEMECDIGPMLMNNARSTFTRVIPVATGFDGSVRKERGGYSSGRALNEKETVYRMLGDERRMAVVCDVVLNTKAETNLILLTRIFAAGALERDLNALNPVVLLPDEFAAPGENEIALEKIGRRMADGAVTVIATYDVAVKLGKRLPSFRHGYAVSPCGAKRMIAAMEPVRRRSNDSEHVIYDFVDRGIGELLESAQKRHAYFADSYSMVTDEMDRRYE